MSVPIIDPRVKRLDLKKFEDETYKMETNSHWVTYEVFHQAKKGKQCSHVGIVHAPNPEMALILAKEQYARRGQTTNLWVAKTSDVYTFSTDEEDIFETTPSKTFRDPGAYKVRDRITEFQKKNGL